MRILVMESINALPDRVLLVQEARRRALTEPAASTFSLTKRRCCSWHDGVDVIAPCLSNRIQVRPLFASKNDPSDGAETGGAEPHIAEQSRSWRAASGVQEVMRGS